MDGFKVEMKAEKARERFQKMSERLRNPGNMGNVIAAKAYKDVIDHFTKEESDEGKWPGWIKNEGGRKKRVNYRPYGRGGTELLKDTGTLRSSIQFKRDGNDFIVYTRNRYAKYHQFGTDKMVKRPFMWLAKEKLSEIVTLYKAFIVGN